MNYVHDYESPSPIAAQYLPVAQSFPVSNVITPYNYNLLSAYSEEVIMSLVERKTALVTVEKYMMTKDLLDLAGNVETPRGRIDYPVLDTASNSLSQNHDNTNATVVGVFSVVFCWLEFLSNILSDDAEGVIVVYENSCNQSFTYQIVSISFSFYIYICLEKLASE